MLTSGTVGERQSRKGGSSAILFLVLDSSHSKREGTEKKHQSNSGKPNETAATFGIYDQIFVVYNTQSPPPSQITSSEDIASTSVSETSGEIIR